MCGFHREMIPMPRIVLLIGTLVWLAGAAIAFAQDSDSSYTVTYGDVLDMIAASVDMSADCIAELSQLENPNKLRPGDTLVFSPSCPPYDGLIPIARDETADQDGGGSANAQSAGSGGDYTVERNDVLDSIAAAFDVSVGCLAEANGLSDPHMIYVGDELNIDLDCPPYDGVDFVRNPRADADQLQQGGGGGAVYIVRIGDTLDKIGAQYDLSPSCLGESNELENPGRIFPGDEIALDPNCPPYDGLALELAQPSESE
jgi:LysM repeat protein